MGGASVEGFGVGTGGQVTQGIEWTTIELRKTEHGGLGTTYALFDARWKGDSQGRFDFFGCFGLSSYPWLPELITRRDCNDVLASDRRRRDPLEERLQRGIVG